MRKRINFYYKTVREWLDPGYEGHPYDKRVFRPEQQKINNWVLNRPFAIR